MRDIVVRASDTDTDTGVGAVITLIAKISIYTGIAGLGESMIRGRSRILTIVSRFVITTCNSKK